VITAVRKLTIKTPGSTANLGPGFDALALALSVHCTLRFELLEKDDPSIPLITLNSELLDELPTDETNMIYQVISSTWRADKELLKRVRITIESDIPPGKGLGSSAAAAIGAVCASYAIADEQYDHDSMLADGKAMLADATGRTRGQHFRQPAGRVGGVQLHRGPAVGDHPEVDVADGLGANRHCSALCAEHQEIAVGVAANGFARGRREQRAEGLVVARGGREQG
jgi:hypothetical protein